MKYISIAVVLFLFVSSTAFPQPLSTVAEEANPSTQYVRDNSPKAQLWRQILEARKANNFELHRQLVKQYDAKYSQTVSQPTVKPQGPSNSILQTGGSSGYSPDWGLDDALVHDGPILSSFTAGNGRTVQLEADTLGNLYAAVLESGRDTLFVYKSVDFGLSWSRLTYVYWTGMSRKWHSFDFFVADTANGMFKLGFIATATSGTNNYDGQAWWISWNDDGTGFQATQIQPTPAGRGYINPAIISDAYDWAPSISYWYVTYQDVDATTGVGNAAIAALTENWGDTWYPDSARSGFDDYDLDIDYNFGADTIHVLLTNNILPPNSNLRVRSISLGDFATSAGWSQTNVASSSAPERLGCLTANRQTNELAVSYTKEESSNENIYYSYSPTGRKGISYWMIDNPLTTRANNESRSRIHCQEEQGAYRLAYVSSGAGDTVIYTSSFSVTGFTQHQVVNQNKDSSPSVGVDVYGFHSGGGAFNGGVIFAGFGPVNAYYDGSNIVVGVDETQFEIPKTYSISQNYPNPFNPVTQIEFTIPAPERVTISLFDILGRKVATLVDKDYASGTFTLTVDGSKLSSGNYFYRMEAGDFVATKKMLLLK
jgi:hypothetical protein